MSTQTFPHWAKPELQLAPQTPPVQVGLPLVTLGQVLPQAPQCWTFLLVSTQEPAQAVLPAEQVARHWPPSHTLSVAQGLAQPPQLPGSI